MIKKHIALFFAVFLFFALAGCNTGTQETVVPQEIVFSPITIDLADPENKVKEADPNENSVVKDATGRALTEEEWLIGCKFSKEYIRSLGVGTFRFSFSSPTKFGNITVTVTDDQAPRYVFDGKISKFVPFGSDTARLPKLLKDQDSYQEDCDEIDYHLSMDTDSGELEILDYVEQANYFELLDVVPGAVYRWKATACKEEKTFEFVYTLKTESFDQYLSRIENEFLYSVEKQAYLPVMEDGSYEVDGRNSTREKSCDFVISNDIMQKVLSAGKTKAIFSFRFIGGNPYDTAINNASDGDRRGQCLNFYNGSNHGNGNAYVFFAMAEPGEKHESSADIVMKMEGEDCLYFVEIPLLESSYAKNETLLFQYMWGATGYGFMSVRFE